MSVADTFLGTLVDADRSAVLSGATERALTAGEALVRHGEAGRTFAVLLTGRFKLVTRASNGRAVLLGLRGPGDLIGEMAVIDAGDRSADVIALEPARVAIGQAETLHRLLRERPGVAFALCRSLGRRLREADDARVELAALTGHARVAGLLLDLSGRYGRDAEGGRRIEIPLTQEELADWTGLSRPAVARALAEFRRDGLVATGRKSITLTDQAAVRAYVRRSRER